MNHNQEGVESPLLNVDKMPLDQGSEGSSQTDLSDVGLCSLNVHEFSYNLLLCYLADKRFDEALEKVEFMLKTINKKYLA
jgi:hypothetical protein